MQAERKKISDDEPLLSAPALSPPTSTLCRQLKNSWAQLHPNIQSRFRQDPVLGQEIIYEGVMTHIRRSRLGWLFAQLTRVIGNPLTPYAGEDVAMEVKLFKRAGVSGVFWQRTYYYSRRAPYIVTSVKRESSRGELMECVGGGFGMQLDISVREGALHFESTRYFWQIAALRLPLPHWLAPGKTHVVHEDLGGGTFRFTIAMDHNQLGRTFFQQGEFHEKKRP